MKPTAPESSIEPSVEPPSPPIDGFADAYKTAFDSIFPDPYVWHRADFVQLKTWRGDYPAIGPERFVEVAKTEWRKGQYCKGSSLTIRGLCTSWAQIVAGQQVGNGQAPGDGMARFHEKQARLDKERREQEAARAPAPAPV